MSGYRLSRQAKSAGRVKERAAARTCTVIPLALTLPHHHGNQPSTRRRDESLRSPAEFGSYP